MLRIYPLRSVCLALAWVAAVGCSAAAPATQTASPQRTADQLAESATGPSAHPALVRYPTAAVVRVARTTYGRALVDARGYALYLFTHDRTGAATCYDACAVAWPAYILRGRPRRASDGARVTPLGSIRRRDGRLQVTYGGHPLYYYIGDRRPGEVLCQAVTEFGGTWYVVAPDGRGIR